MSAPETTPTPAPTTPEAESAAPEGEAGFDFAGLASHDDSAEPSPAPIGTEAAPASAASPPPASSAPTATPPVQTPPAVAAAPSPAQPPVPPAEPQAPQPPVATAPEPAPGTIPEQLSIEKHREKFLPQLTELYKLSDAEVEGLQTNPGAVLPQLAAKLHYEVQMAAFQGILQVLPNLIQTHQKVYQESQKNADAFYSKWPKLKEAIANDPKLEASIERAIRSYRAVNPTASIEQVINEAGMMAMVHLKLPLEFPAAGNGAVPPAPPAPPTRPAGVGATGHVPQPRPLGGQVREEDIFGDLAEAHARGDI